jgi:hypothetical protein
MLPLSYDQTSPDGTTIHYITDSTLANGQPGSTRAAAWIEDRSGKRTTFTYDQTVTLADGSTRKLLTRVTDPSGRYLTISWINIGTAGNPWRIQRVEGPLDAGGLPIYAVSYEYNTDGNLWKVHQDPEGLNRVTTFTYTTVNGESGLLDSITDPLGHRVSYHYSLPQGYISTGTLCVDQITEPGSGGDHVFNIGFLGDTAVYITNNGNEFPDCPAGYDLAVGFDPWLRLDALAIMVNCEQFQYWYDSSFNVTRALTTRWQANVGETPVHNRWLTDKSYTYDGAGNMLTETTAGFTGDTTTYTYWGEDKLYQKQSVTDALGHTTQYDYYGENDPDTTSANLGKPRWCAMPATASPAKSLPIPITSTGRKPRRRTSTGS